MGVMVHFLITQKDVHTMVLYLLQYGSSALVEAACGGHTRIVEMLLSHPSIDANLQTKVVSYFFFSSCPIANNFVWRFHILFCHIVTERTFGSYQGILLGENRDCEDAAKSPWYRSEFTE